MLITRHITLVLALLLATIGTSQSQQPPPSGGESAQTQQSNPGPQKPTQPPVIVTKDSHLVVEFQIAPPTEAAINQDPSDREEKTANDRKLVKYAYDLDILTGILAAVGALQLLVFGWQGWQLKRSVDFGERRDRVLERAYLWPGPGASESSQHGRRRFHITVHNTGKTVGIITDVFYKLSTEAELNSKDLKFDHHQYEDVIPPDMDLGAQKLTGASVELIGTEPKILHGHIVYTDVFKLTHKCPWKHWLYPDGNSKTLAGCYTEWD